MGLGFSLRLGYEPVMPDPRTPAEWFARAEEAKSIAERMQNALARKTMLEIAAGYERLASYATTVHSRATTKDEPPSAA